MKWHIALLLLLVTRPESGAAFLPPAMDVNVAGIGTSSVIQSQKVRDIIPPQVLDFDIDSIGAVSTTKQALQGAGEAVDTTFAYVDAVQKWKDATAETYAENTGKGILDLIEFVSTGTKEVLQDYYPVLKDVEAWQMEATKDYQNGLQNALATTTSIYESSVPLGVRNGQYLRQVKEGQQAVVQPYNKAITTLLKSETYAPTKAVLADAYEKGVTNVATATTQKVFQPTVKLLADQSQSNFKIADTYQGFITGTSANVLKPAGQAFVATGANLAKVNQESVAPGYEQFITGVVRNPAVDGLTQTAGSALASTQTVQGQLAAQYESAISQFADTTVAPALEVGTAQLQAAISAVEAQLPNTAQVQLDLAVQYNSFVTEKSAELIQAVQDFDYSALSASIQQFDYSSFSEVLLKVLQQ